MTQEANPASLLDVVHVPLLTHALSSELTEEDALLWMLLLHTHEIRLCEGLRHDECEVDSILPLAWSGCAYVMAQVWNEITHEQTPAARWLHSAVGRFPMETLDRLSIHDRDAVSGLRRILSGHPDVAEVKELAD